jgi:isopentenyl-diphosphate delta-isomerase
MAKPGIEGRKSDHIEVAASGRADFRETGTLLECVQMVHQSLPERSLDQIDLSTDFLGKTLKAPIIISGMTGGTPEARDINRDLAQAAQEMGLGFGVGSQRAMIEKPELASTYEVRDVAPDALLIGNIGAVQAREYGAAAVSELAKGLGADAMAVHLNPAQEMIQREGDRDFSGILDTIRELVDTLDVPVMVKETGCGLSAQSARSLVAAGVQHVDVSGAGGTSWVAVERHRAGAESREQKLGDEYWDWGLPTAVSVHGCAKEGLQVVATGGIRSGLDIARAITLGARAGGLAAPVLRAQRAGGREAVLEFLESLRESLLTALLLTGCRTPSDLGSAPRHIKQPLRGWIEDLG